MEEDADNSAETSDKVLQNDRNESPDASAEDFPVIEVDTLVAEKEKQRPMTSPTLRERAKKAREAARLKRQARSQRPASALLTPTRHWLGGPVSVFSSQGSPSRVVGAG